MSSLQSSVGSPHVKHESSTHVVSSTSTSKDTIKKGNLGKIKKLLEQLEDVLVMAANDIGDVEVLSSPNLKHHKWAIMQMSQETFKQYLEDRSPELGRTIPDAARLGAGQTSQGRSQFKKSVPSRGRDASSHEGSINYVAQRSAKRKRSRASSGPRAGLPVTIPVRQPHERRSPAPMLQIEVRETKKLEKWFREAFWTMQQVACRLVAKVWIKRIHPKKQSTHPYNGGIPRDQRPDPNRTRPPYWPIDVVHREPDHIAREERVKLLVHLIMHTPQPVILNSAPPEKQLNVTAQELLECLEEKRGELKAGPYEIIEEVIRARDNMELFESGGMDGESLLFLPDYSDRSTQAQIESEAEPSSADGKGHAMKSEGSAGDDMGEERTVTPESSTLHSPADIGRGDLRGDDRSLGNRSRRAVNTEKHRNKLNVGQRSRSLLSASQVPQSVTPRGSRDIPIEMAMGMGRFESNMDATMQDAMVDQPRPRVRQVHVQTPMILGMNQQLPTELSAHEVVLLDHQGPHDLLGGIPHAMQGRDGTHYQPWLPVLSDLTPGPSHGMFGIPSHMSMQAQELQHTYFDTSPTELVGGIQSVLPLLDHPPYSDVSHHLNRPHPIRGMSDPQTPTEHDLDASNTSGPPFYHM